MMIKQSTLSMLVGSTFLTLALLLAGAVYFANLANAGQIAALAWQAESKQLGIDLADASDFLTDAARQYVVTADPKHYQAYWNEIEVTKNRDRVLARLAELDTPQAEFDLIALAKKNSDALVTTETRAMRLVLEATAVPEAKMHPAVAAFKLSAADRALEPNHKLAMARTIMFDDQYAKDKAIIMGPVADFQQQMNARLDRASQAAGDQASLALKVLVALTVILAIGIGGALWLLYTTMGAPVVRYVRALQSQDAADETSRQTKSSAEYGVQAVQQTVAGMAEIQTVVSQASSKVEDLGRLGERIGAGVETIDDIAEQTNLLALNAAIEAARAGEHGRGFAVVADEVRKLAERSQRETRAISELIRDVQVGTREAVEAMEQGAARVNAGSAEAGQAGQALTAILDAVQATSRQVEEIATAAQEMAIRARDVGGTMGSIAAVAEQSSAATEEVSASAEEMSAQIEGMTAQAASLGTAAAELKALVDQFGNAETIEDADDRPVAQRQTFDWIGGQPPRRLTAV